MEDVSAWPEYMTVAEVAGIMHVGKMTVYRLVNADVLPSTRVGKVAIRIKSVDLREYLGLG